MNDEEVKMEQKHLDGLKRVRERLSKPEAWTKGASARDINGRQYYTPPRGMKNESVAWCLIGAMSAEDVVYHEVKLLFSRITRSSSIADWNDDPFRTHSEVLDVLDKMIAALEAQL